ncbi:MAG: tetratricopeptide repeat protein, partial [Planctomycetota bacterium]|nr:tetratricopeptide repeat protein [Planctomycetota bacterium]
MRRASDVPGTQRGVLLVVLALLLLGGANAVRAEDEPAARKPTNEGRASDAFLAARAAGDEKRMGEIANVASTSADPWRVTDALLARGEVEAARDLTKRARRPELSRLAGYVEEAIATPRPAASREVFERMVHGRTGLSHAESLELIARVDVELLDVPTVVTLFWLGNTHYLLGEFDQTIDACRRAGEVAAAIGWTRMAAAQYALAGAVASDQKQEDVAMELIARQMENEFEGESAHGVDAASRVRPILLRRSMAAITGRGASDQEGLSYLGKLPVGPLFGELSRCSPNASTTWFLALGFQMGGETDRARALLENVRDRARYFASASDAAVLSSPLGEVYMASGRPSRGLETLTESIARARAEEMFVVATLATTVASMCAASLGEYERALGLAAQGLALVEEHGARVAAPVLYTAIARCEVNQGAYHAALRHLEKARGLHTALGAKTDATATGMEIGNVHVGLGDLDAAYAEFHAVQEQSEALKDVRGALSAMANLGVVELERGRLAEAEGIFRDVVTRARESKRPKSLAVGLTNLADVQRLRGRLDDAVATQDEALVVAGAQDLTRLLGDVHVDRALTELARG